ncbi:tricarboxylate transporter [Bordetella sp. H567]|uniref:Bug family tripartite tricarboxylate transporter substrate binding protein n=1 Tax=Bordetella sp. H567 TaxID=1697043 RepID=UPI00081C47D2|nr:tripartite tricarboxylate transporter substrate binding protein [Bordetella sp. H567]AOB33680.1 tricarboxylate transporter [Bordetella sp. H567]
METSKARSVIALAMAALMPAAAWAWEPTKPVEIIVPFSAGGASDQMARTIQGIVAKHELMKQPLIVVNKAGASGAEGLMDAKSASGDPHKLLVASSALYTVPLISKLPFNWRDLSPVAMVAVDEFILWVNAKAPYQTVDQFIAAAKANKLKMGGTSSKREDQMITAMVEHATGAKFIYVPYKGGGEAATQLSGNHIDANVNNPAESVAQWRAGEHRALCVFAEQRLAYTHKVTDTQSWADIPTCKEKGLDVHYEMLRIFLLPGKVAPDQVAYYTDVFKKISETPEWKQYLERSALKPELLTGTALNQYLEKDEAMHKDIIKSAGF